MAAASEKQKKSTFREYFEALLIAIIFVNFSRIFVFQTFKIPTPSMEDNLKVGDHIIVNKFIYGPIHDTLLARLVPLREIRRGDIIVFRYPEHPETDYVKRVIGIPGDIVDVRDKQVFINGKQTVEPYVLHVDPRMYPDVPALGGLSTRDQFGPVTIGPHEYFAMGDNRDQSYDSRFWGPVPRGMIKGRAFVVYWSYEIPPPPQGSPPSARMKELFGVVKGFFKHTRWKRTFFIVDSKYHYTPGITSHVNQ